MRTLFWRIAGTFRKRRLDEEFDEEVREHLEMLEQRYVRQGMSPQSAHYAARRQFGGHTSGSPHERHPRVSAGSNPGRC
jgi:hypothetical protein